MSITKSSTLSTTYECFLILQNHLYDSLDKLSDNTPVYLKQALKSASNKLTEYLY